MKIQLRSDMLVDAFSTTKFGTYKKNSLFHQISKFPTIGNICKVQNGPTMELRAVVWFWQVICQSYILYVGFFDTTLVDTPHSPEYPPNKYKQHIFPDV